jgi:hypothetical protein
MRLRWTGLGWRPPSETRCRASPFLTLQCLTF